MGVSADADFGTLLATRSSRQPSVIQFRGEGSRKPEALARTLLANLPQLVDALENGSTSRSSRLGCEYACFRLAPVFTFPDAHQAESSSASVLGPRRIASGSSCRWPTQPYPPCLKLETNHRFAQHRMKSRGRALGRRGSLVRIQSPRYLFSGAILSEVEGSPRPQLNEIGFATRWLAS
jgi:hypothetical protein